MLYTTLYFVFLYFLFLIFGTILDFPLCTLRYFVATNGMKQSSIESRVLTEYFNSCTSLVQLSSSMSVD